MSSIMQYNGAAVIAMAGKECIAIASDRRYGIRNQTMGACCASKTSRERGDAPLPPAGSRTSLSPHSPTGPPHP